MPSAREGQRARARAVLSARTSSRLAIVVTLLVAIVSVAPARAAAPTYPLTLTAGSRLLVKARINGRAVTALLDSAAEETLIDPAFAGRLGLGAGRTVTAQGSGAAAFEAGEVGGVTLEAFGLKLAGQTVAVTDLTDVGRRLLGRPIEVILGREVFDAARLSIDIEGRRVTVADRRATPPGIRLGLLSEHGVETIPVGIEDGEEVRATFDLGNGSYALVGSSLVARLGWLGDGRAVRTEKGGGLGGEIARQVITLRHLTIAGRRFEGVEAAIDAGESAADLNVGVALLRHFLITTDFAEHAVWLQSRD